MTRLIVVRHAQSIANLQRVFLGHSNWDLSDLGREQAELLAKYLIEKKFPIDVIYSSDLIRPVHTVEPYAKATGKEITRVKELREIYAGEWEEKKFDDLLEKYPESYGVVWRTDIGNAKCNGGEAVSELYERVNSAIDEIAQANDGKCVLVATHATPLRALIARAKGVGLDGMKDFYWGENACINIFEYSEGVLSAVELLVSEHLGEARSGLPRTV